METTPASTTSRAPAPGRLLLVQAFVNTKDVESGGDEVETPSELRDWLAARGLQRRGRRLGEADVRRAAEVREALRELLAANDGGRPAGWAVRALNRLGAGLLVSFGQDGRGELRPAAEGVQGALSELLAIVLTSMVDGTWSRLKVCREDTCRWAFYDHSKNRSGRWCSMAVCGNRTKARAYRRRSKG